MPFDALLMQMPLGLAKQAPSRGLVDVVIYRGWRPSAEALGLPSYLPSPRQQSVAAGQERLAE